MGAVYAEIVNTMQATNNRVNALEAQRVGNDINRAPECATTALTQLNGHCQRCANPFCAGPVRIKSPRGKHGRYCSKTCRMDGYALRRAKALLAKVGVIRFHELLDEV
jgi:hypothetical protein